MTSPKVSIIIVNYKDELLLHNCLKSIKNSFYKNIEIIVVNNISSDNFIKETTKKFKELKIIKNSNNLGFAKANNQGAKIAKGKYLFFLNNDTKIKKNTISLLVSKIENTPKTAIITAKIFSYDGKKYFHSGIGIDIFGFPINNNHLFYAEGSALMINKEIFYKIGLFDDNYFMFHEDIDLCWRTQLYGYKIICQKKAIVYHYSGKSASGKLLKNKYHTTFLRRFLSERNNIKTLLKCYSLKYLLLIIPIYIFINLLEMIFFILILKPKISFLYIKAWWWNILNLKSTLQKRKIIQTNRKIKDNQIIKKMSFEIGKLNVLKSVGIPIFK
jgi:GT2 family glycosyltransferase